MVKGLLRLLALAAATSTTVSSGQTLVVNGINDYAAPGFVTAISATADMLTSASRGSDIDLIPLTVMVDSSSQFTTDVFGHFTHRVRTKLSMPARAYTSSIQSQGYNFTGWRTAVPAGSYFIFSSTGEGLKPNTDGSYSILSAAIPGAQNLTIGVPSKLYYTKTAGKPLAGIRVGIKDIYDIAGIKTSCGNRAYYNLYPPRTVTGTAVQRLIDAGAIIIGKMKTSQFANGETATADWDPSTSSSGPGAGIGAYDWLDIRLGSDTGGSIRGPPEVNGCFGNRPSHGLVPLDHVMPLSPNLDTAGFRTRDPYLWHEAAKALSLTSITDNGADAILVDFLSKLQTFLGAPTPTPINLSALWSANAPAAGGGASLSTYLGIVYPVLISQQQYSLFTLPFCADYAAAHQGRRPFIDPVPLIRWAFGQNNISADASVQALQNKTVFMDWFASKVVLPSEETCSDSVLIYVGSDGSPNYRNEYFSAPGPPTGFGLSRVSPLSEVPDFVFPIGQAAYNSTITLKEEYLLVAIDIIAAKGCDEALTMAGILKILKTGSVMY
ncbi:putative Glutamyl-tRNA amidotransferase subunit A [Hyaloscypha finlandica]|nr:putative Glutamyl-tRNA amidotransferase subunit A [Hyaloscypha finlandica]